MAFEHKENTGTIFLNEKKSENAPDWKGKLNINGELKDIAGWIKKDGMISLKISEPYKK